MGAAMKRNPLSRLARTAFVFAVVPIGLALEFLVEFPFFLATVLGGRTRGRRS
jgi:hypothetical protein